MNQKKQSAESKVKEIRRHTRKKYSAEEKIRIVIDIITFNSYCIDAISIRKINPSLLITGA